MNFKDIAPNLTLYYSLYLIAYCSLFYSCNSGSKYSKETRTLDSLQTLVQKADSSLKIIDTVKLNKCVNHIVIDQQLLKMYRVDTMSNEAAEAFRNYASVRWALATVSIRKRPLIAELEKSSAQLAHLSHDLKHGIIKGDSIQIYVGFESKKASELIEVSNKSVNDMKMQLPMYEMITPQTDSLIGRVKEHKKI